MLTQKTVKNVVKFAGIGVHTGVVSYVEVHPAPVDYGLVFVNEQKPELFFKVGTVVPEAAMHATVFNFRGWVVSTVEHLMAALYALGITNAQIHVRGSEIPILDGSAFIFAQEVKASGIEDQGVLQMCLRPKAAIKLHDEQGRFIVLDPTDSEDLEVDYSGDFKHPLVGAQAMQGIVSEDFFMHQVAPARTFGFLAQLPLLRKHQLALGSSLGNTVVIGDEMMNEMRLPDECIRHKVLDLIGDLSLLGMPLVAHVTAHKTSHQFNRLVVQHRLNNPELWLIA